MCVWWDGWAGWVCISNVRGADWVQSKSKVNPVISPCCARLFTWDRGALSQPVTSARVNTRGGGALHIMLFSAPLPLFQNPSPTERHYPPTARGMGCWCKIICSSQSEDWKKRRGGGRKREILLILAIEGRAGSRVHWRRSVFRRGWDMGECLGTLG